MRLLLLALSLTPLLASADLDRWDKNEIRKHYQEQAFNRPGTVRGKPVDQKYMEKRFPDTVTIDQPRLAPLPEIPSVQVFAGRELPFERFISLLAKSIGYNSPDFFQVPVSLMERPIILNSRVQDLPSLISWLEVKTGTRIAVYPDSRTIQVSASHEHTGKRQRN